MISESIMAVYRCHRILPMVVRDLRFTKSFEQLTGKSILCQLTPLLHCDIKSVGLNQVVTSTRSFYTTPTALNNHVFNVQDETDFDERVKKNAIPVVIDFHASWCGPCKLLGPRLESLIAGKSGKVVLAKVDIDELSDLAISYGVEAVPTVIGMKNGKVVDKFIGLKDDADLEAFVDKLAN